MCGFKYSYQILIIYTQLYSCSVGWGWWIHWLLFCRSVRLPPNECLRYDTKQSDGEVPVMLELWGMRSTPSLPSLPGPLWPGVVAPDRVLSMSQIDQTVYLCSTEFFERGLFWHLNCVLMLNWIVWNGTVFVFETELFEIELFWHLTVCKQKLYLYQTELFEIELFEKTE